MKMPYARQLIFISMLVIVSSCSREQPGPNSKTIDADKIEPTALASYNDLMSNGRYWDARILASRFMPDTNESKVLIQAAEDKALSRYQSLMQNGKFLDASNYVSTQMKSHPNAPKLIADAEVQKHIQTINDPKASKSQKQEAYIAIDNNHPYEAGKYSLEIKQAKFDYAKQSEAAERRREATIRAEARKHGVTIGMTREDVVMSSWGRPQDINRTTSAHGVREQWIYGGRNYLYFENGVLTAIQN